MSTLASSSILCGFHSSTGLKLSEKNDAVSRETAHAKQASAEMVSVNVKLIPPGSAFHEINKFISKVRNFHTGATLPWSDGTVETDSDGGMLRKRASGEQRILPLFKFQDYADKMREFSIEYEQLLDRALGTYADLIESQRQYYTGLGQMFDADKYPPAEVVRAGYKMWWDTSPVPESGDFRLECDEEAKREMEDRLNIRIREAEKAAQNELAKRLAEPLANIATKLRAKQEKDPNKFKVFKDTLIGNLRDVLEVFDGYNVTSDRRLSEIKNMAVDVAKFDPEQIREGGLARNVTANRADETLAKLTSMFPSAAA